MVSDDYLGLDFEPQLNKAEPRAWWGTILNSVGGLLDSSVEGDLAEVGCWCGDLSLRLATLMADRNALRTVWAFDTFAGFVTDDVDGGTTRIGQMNTGEAAYLRLLKYSRSLPLIPVKGDVRETMKCCSNRRFAFLLFDMDQGELTQHAFDFFAPLVTNGGVIGFHDYGHPSCPGIKRVVDGILGLSGWSATGDRVQHSLILLKKTEEGRG